MVNAKLDGNPNVSWTLAGVSCSGSGCGSLSSTTGSATTYTAPVGITAATQVTLTAAVPGTQNHSTVNLTVNPDPAISGTPPSGLVGSPYTTTLTASGGTTALKLSIASGSLPAGLTFDATTGAISGTPTAAGTYHFVAQVIDASDVPDTVTAPETITIAMAAAAVPLVVGGTPPAGTVGTPYSAMIGVSGGTAPYSCTASAAALPAGLTLGAGCVVSGTATAAGTTPVTVTVTDSGSPMAKTAAPVNITVQPVPPLTLAGSIPNATLEQLYTQTLHASGGMAPYTYTVTVGTLPAGLSLSPAGVISGTPTAVGASSFTVVATDSESTPQTASLPLVLMVVYPATATDAELQGPYAFLFQGYDDVAAGVFAFQTATAGSFTADGTGVLSAGELDANHQGSNSTGTMISSNVFLGSYTIGANHRGSLTITTLNADGTTDATSTYAIAVKPPVMPSTVSARVDLIEFDNDQIRGSKASGTILAQQPAAFAAGLNGSYAFGFSGDTPCLPTCTVGIVAGPVASVGRFTADASGVISGGLGDENVASANFPNSTLTGSYGAADANGRLQLTMQTSGTPAVAYPSDYAVYLVSANQAFVLSTDKHSAYILLAGSAQLQTQSDFSNASLSGPFVGYENSPVNPGLVGATLQNTLNLSTATIFRGTADSAGTCATTNVDVGGVTGLVNELTGQGSGAPALNALLGTYQATGNSACTVTASGRGLLNYPVPNNVLTLTLGALGLPTTPPPARVLYLYGPNQGYFLETGYAGLGNLEAQTGAPFTTATLNGTFTYGTAPASSLASTDGSGSFLADGAGHATSTLDLNVGVGTINVLQLGTSGTSNYSLTDATAGRYLLGANTVIYAISPGRFVLLDTSALTTSPSIALLY